MTSPPVSATPGVTTDHTHGRPDDRPAVHSALSQRGLDAYERVGKQRIVTIPNKAAPDTWATWFTGWLTTAAEAIRSLALGSLAGAGYVVGAIRQGIHIVAAFVANKTEPSSSMATEAERGLARLFQQAESMADVEFEQEMQKVGYTESDKEQARARRARSPLEAPLQPLSVPSGLLAEPG